MILGSGGNFSNIFSFQVGIVNLLQKIRRPKYHRPTGVIFLADRSNEEPAIQLISSGKESEEEAFGDVENYLLTLCRVLSQENKLIQIEHLLIRARREAKIPPSAIQRAIDNLIRAKKIVPNTFIHSENVMDNQTRVDIVNHVASTPSILAYDLKKELGIGAKILAWHLKKLLDFDTIKLVQCGSKKLFCTKETPPPEAIIYFLMNKNPAILSTIKLLLEKPVEKNQLIEKIHSPRSTILYHLKNLEGMGILTSVANSAKYVQVASAYEDAARKIISLYFSRVSRFMPAS